MQMEMFVKLGGALSPKRRLPLVGLVPRRLLKDSLGNGLVEAYHLELVRAISLVETITGAARIVRVSNGLAGAYFEDKRSEQSLGKILLAAKAT